MNPVKHCFISAKRWGGKPEDYYEIHSFIDHTKSLCSDIRHRILHTLWGVNHLVIPIFGHTLFNSDGKGVDVKDLCERDHLIVDYHSKFIPTLSDFVEAINDDYLPNDFKQRIETIHSIFIDNQNISDLMLSPLAQTGRIKSLLITHNSWFVNSILPRLFDSKPLIEEFVLEPSHLFNSMRVELWMDNGASFPNSARMFRDTQI
jgi:hypothetical protein